MCHLRSTKRGWRRERRAQGLLQASSGQSLLEFVLVLPVLLIVILGAIDYGRVYFDYISVTNAARNGAVYASAGPEAAQDVTGIRSAALEELNQGQSGDAVVSSTTNADTAGNLYAKVTVEHTFRTLVSWPALPSSIHLERSVQMRVAP